MAQDPQIGREILPIPDRPAKGKPALDARDAEFPSLKPLRPPEGAPNVVIVLIDDMGFGCPSTFGGPVDMPTLARLAKGGLKFNRFHTTALCSPTRQALLTGRNHHTAEMGSISETATSIPGYTSVRPNSVATVTEMLRLNGYNTGAFGKMHQTPAWEVSTSGPFDRWPTGEGFEKFYGFLGGEANQWTPSLFEGTTPIEPPDKEGYHLSEDLADQAISWMQQQQALTPDKPFFTYLSFGATHAPHHVAKEWIEKYRGRFDRGWDKMREETLERQKELGIVPRETRLTDRHEEIQAWAELTDDERKVFTRLMEVYAGFAEHTDHQVGRFMDALEELGIMENTLVFYIAGDNGASAEGGLNGTANEISALNGFPDTIESTLKALDELGSENTYNHYPAGWAHAMDTPFQWTKQVASHWGGTRNGMVAHWPKGFKSKGEIRQQFHHVIDVAPTILEAAGLPEPYMVNGVAQKPIEGVSLAYTFDAPDATDRHTTQYFEMFGNRGIYHNGWTAVTKHRTPWDLVGKVVPFSEDDWELYDTISDWSQANNLADKHPEKLRELYELFMVEAAKYNVFPMDDRTAERFNAEIAGRPDLMGGRTSLTLRPGMTHLMENTVLNVKNKSYTVIASLDIPEEGGEGVVIAQGGRFAGWSLYVKNGKPTYCHNWFNSERFYVNAKEPLPPGPVTVKFSFDYDGGKPGAGGTGTLSVNGKQVAESRIERTVPMMFDTNDGMEIGMDLGSKVTEDYPDGSSPFNGKIDWVRIDVGGDDQSHKVSEEQQYHMRMGKQ